MKLYSSLAAFIFWGSIYQSAFASGSLRCEGWYQAENEKLQKAEMKVDEQTNLNWKQSVSIGEYRFAVNWDVNLDAFYTEVFQNDKRILFTTARVPTFNHNDSFTDIKIPGGPRLAVSCDFR